MSPRKSYIVATLLIMTFVVFIAAENIKLYSDKYDNVDVNAILANGRQRNQYYDCLYGSAPCLTPDAKFLKEKFSEAIVTKCKYCTAKQKIMFEKIVLWYMENDIDGWNALLKKTIEGYRSAGAH